MAGPSFSSSSTPSLRRTSSTNAPAPSASPARAAPLEPPCCCPLHQGTYVKEKHVGKGASGDVFMARCGERQVALKQMFVPTDALRDDFLLRAEQYQQLSHPHIIRYEDCFEHTELSSRYVVIVMPYFPLGEVTCLLQQMPRVEESLLLKIGLQVADALCYLHTLKPAPIVHRDVKPENLLWDGQNVVLTDLETVKFLHATHVAGATGTYPYQSPEQMEQGLTTEKADVWALGCVLFAMATKPPYPDIMHVEVRQRADFPQWLTRRMEERRYSSAFATTILLMLKPDPRRRLTAGQVRDHCRQLMQDAQ